MLSKLQFLNKLKYNPDDVGALEEMGDFAVANGRTDLAIEAFTKALRIKPICNKILLKRGKTYAKQRMLNYALSDFSQSILHEPHSAEPYMLRGTLFGRIGNLDRAVLDFSQAIVLRPELADAYYNRGLVYQKKYQIEQALQDYKAAINIERTHIHALNNRGMIFRDQKLYKKAINDFRTVLSIRPDFAQTHWNKALTHFMIGDYQSAWKHFEKRWDCPTFTSKKRTFNKPLWLGNASLQKRSILLHSEQGLGDSIQYCRYIKSLETKTDKIFLEVEKPLATLMHSLVPPGQIFIKGDKLPKFDFHCPLMSLPLAFNTTITSVPFAKPYLHVSSKRIDWWKKYLSDLKGLKVGVVWQGNPQHPNDAKRSIALEFFLEKLQGNINWISLQKELSNEDSALIKKQKSIIHFGDLIGDFHETGALCQAVDAIVSVDTSIVHLAGSIGQKVHLLLAYNADSRWHENRSDSPWYSSVRIYRQDKNCDWAKPLAEVMRNLTQQI